MAPELSQGQPPSQASDLFAFGVVLHEVFTGQKPTAAPDRLLRHRQSAIEHVRRAFVLRPADSGMPRPGSEAEVPGF